MNEKLREQLENWEKAGNVGLAAQFMPKTADPEKRTVDCVWYTGAEVERYSWIEGPYMLAFDKNGADLSILNNGAPVCDNHGIWSVEDQLGSVVKAWEKGGQYMATLQFRRSTELTGPRPEADGLWQDILDGIVSKFSMGVKLVEYVDTRDAKTNKLEKRTATKWQPFEISIAPVPADNGTTTLSRDTHASAKAPAVAPASHEVMRAAIERDLLIAKLR